MAQEFTAMEGQLLARFRLIYRNIVRSYLEFTI
jgi:hypothetical protein